jgi:hypothetical protein
MMNLLIDDLRNFVKAPKGLVVCRNSEDALAELRKEDAIFTTIWLDHDLGGEDTINPVIDYLCERSVWEDPVRVLTIYVHTSNPVGASQMMQTLAKYGYSVVRVNADNYFIV